jgi:hypothetical protein
MKLSEMPELMKVRDKIAKDLHRRRGGDYMAAVREANGIVQRTYQQAQAVAEARPPQAPKRAGKKAGKASIGAAVGEAVGRAVAEALSGAKSAGAALTASTAGSRPLHEISSDELADRVGDAFLRAPVTEAAAAGKGAPSVREVTRLVQEAVKEGVITAEHAAAVLREHGVVTEDNAPTGEDLRKMGDDELMSHLGAAFIADGEQRLSSPFFGGANAVPSPFMRDLQ